MYRRLRSALPIVLILLAWPQPPVRAGAPLPGPPSSAAGAPAPDSIDGRFAAAPSCREMSDGCRVCVRGADGTPSCSLPGIACTPAGWQCKRSAPDATDSRDAAGRRR